jgi:acetoin utilization deacetylase AcuC-like enzyme
VKAIYSDRYVVDLKAHVFVTGKYRLVKEALIKEGIEIVEPEAPSWQDLLVVHTEEYLDDLKSCRLTKRTITSELPIEPEVIDASKLGAGGTLLTAKIALAEGVAFHIGGGLHHAYPDHAEGFCYINDVAFALKSLLKAEEVGSAVIIDCDLHQGNGDAFIFQDDFRVFTFSIHEEDIYPVKEESDLDIGLPGFITDEEYLHQLSGALESILDRRYDLAIYIAGSDPFKGDRLGRLALTISGLLARDRMVLESLKERSIPVAIVMGGGYAVNIEDTVTIHRNTAVLAQGLFA